MGAGTTRGGVIFSQSQERGISPPSLRNGDTSDKAFSVTFREQRVHGAYVLPPFCDEWVRRLLRGAGMRAQRIRTWKTSHDPAFDRKKIFRTSEPPRILPRAACPLSVNDRL